VIVEVSLNSQYNVSTHCVAIFFAVAFPRPPESYVQLLIFPIAFHLISLYNFVL